MEIQKATLTLCALAQKARLEILRLLVTAGSEGIAAGIIGQRLKLPPATLSFHLTQLTQAGLIIARRKSRSIFYASNVKAVNDLLRFLIDNCCTAEDPVNLPIQSKKPRLKLRLKSDEHSE